MVIASVQAGMAVPDFSCEDAARGSVPMSLRGRQPLKFEGWCNKRYLVNITVLVTHSCAQEPPIHLSNYGWQLAAPASYDMHA